ncbi:MAG: FG-GAP-like repeat-containing protein [Deferrisomatales bacterium]
MTIPKPHAVLPSLALAALFAGTAALARLPEPDHILYGNVTSGGQPVVAGTVVAKLGDGADTVATCTLGGAADPSFCVLRVPMDAVDPRRPGAARKGDVAKLYFGPTLLGTVAVGERGEVQEVALDLDPGVSPDLDTDGDGLPDAWEVTHGFNPNDPADGGQDADGDGLTNRQEYQLGLDPRTPQPAGPPLLLASLLALLDASSPSALALGDLNGDGKVDLAVADADAGRVLVYLGDGLGGLGEPTPYAVAGKPVALALGAIPGEGNGAPDLVVGFEGSKTLAVLQNDGAGAFVPGTAAVTLDATPTALVLRDLDGDGTADLAAAGGTAAWVLWGQTAGGFGAPAVVYSGGTPIALAAGDLSGDGRVDLAVLDQEPARVALLLGTPGRAFGVARRLSTRAASRAVVLADFDGDTRLDLGVLSAELDPAAPGRLSVFFGNGEGSFRATSALALGLSPAAAVAGDLNRDGLPELVVADRAGGQVVVLGPSLDADSDGLPDAWEVAHGFDPNDPTDAGQDADGDGLTNRAEFRQGTNPKSPDTDGDGLPDEWETRHGLAPTNPADAALDPDGDGLTNLREYALGTRPGVADGLAVIDTEEGRAGRAQIVAPGLARQTGLTYAVWAAPEHGVASVSRRGVATYLPGVPFQGADGFKVRVTAPDGAVEEIAVAVTVHAASQPPAVVPHGASAALAGAGGGQAVLFADLDGDGKLDLAVADGAAGVVRVYLGNGAGGFSHGGDYDAGGWAGSLTAGDLNRDGRPDLVVTGGRVASRERLAVLLNDGRGGFKSPRTYQSGTQPACAALGDLNGDGHPDLAVGNAGSKDLRVHLGDGTGVLRLAATIPTGYAPTALAVHDLDGDGKPDLVAALRGADAVSIFRGTGSGSFSLFETRSVGTLPTSLVVGDVDGNGIPDLAVGNEGSGDVAVCLGLGNGGFEEATRYALNGVPRAVMLADRLGDGVVGLTILDEFGRVLVLPADGAGSFGAPLVDQLGGSPSALAVGDVDGDGRLDLVVADETAGTVAVYRTAAAEALPPPGPPPPPADGGGGGGGACFVASATGELPWQGLVGVAALVGLAAIGRRRRGVNLSKP